MSLPLTTLRNSGDDIPRNNDAEHDPISVLLQLGAFDDCRSVLILIADPLPSPSQLQEAIEGMKHLAGSSWG